MPNESSKSLSNILSFPSVQELLIAIVNVAIVIATPIVVFYIIWAGFLYVTARGNAEQIKKASKALMYGVVGGVIIIGGVAIVQIVSNVVKGFA